jgi:ABC-type polysaccharide transport system permease subunit
VHIWKSLPFWTLILVAGRLAIPTEQYEAASVDGASSLAEIPLHHLAVDEDALPHLADPVDDLDAG